MTRGVVLVLLFFIVLELTKATFIPVAKTGCRSKCDYKETRVACNGKIPISVPDTVKELLMWQIDSREFYPGRFCHVSWPNVTFLLFEGVAVVDFTPFRLRDHVFKCLKNITKFKFSSAFLRHVSTYTFSDLINVVSFDLSECKNISWKNLYHTLALRSNLPNLTTLYLSGAGIYKPLHLNQLFINILSYRRISYLDLSYSFFSLDFVVPGKLCETLKKFRYAGAQFTITHKFRKKCAVCNSLEEVDNSDDKLLKNIFRKRPCINRTENFRARSLFFRNMKVLYVNQIVTPFEKYFMSNCSWILWKDTFVEKLYFSNNYLPHFDVRLINSRLEFIALSNNEIENINQNAFRNLSSLHALDLSYNKLSQVKAFDRTFTALFRYNQHLESIDLSNNKLQWLPEGTFLFNSNLTNLVLSHNMFQQITFNMSVLLDLTTLDLSFNLIQSLNENSRKRLDTMYERQIQQHNAMADEKGIRLILTGNPFSCSCSSLDFIKWFVASPIFSANRSEYHCKLDGKSFLMSDAAVTASMEDCRKTKRKLLVEVLSSTLPTTAALAMAVVLVVLYKRRKRKLFHQHFEDRIRHLRDNTNHFPVLLSYSSQDNEFVEQHVLQQLQQHLQTITMIDRDLVCNAERHFVPGRPILNEIFRCLSESEVFVAVISRNYCSSRFCHYEIDHAHLLKKPIILIFMEHVEEDAMNLATREVFETFTRVKFVVEDGQYKIKPDWPDVCEAIIQLM